MHQELFKLLTQKLYQLYNAGFDHIIAPPFCVYCKKLLSKHSILCIDCDQLIDPIVSIQIPITSQQKMTVMAIAGYQEPLKSMILAKSWGNIITSQQLGQLLWEKTYFSCIPCDYIIPIPLHWVRFARRGYNQAQEMACVVASKKNVPVANILVRHKHTPFQSSLAYDKRLNNVKTAFSLKKNIDRSLYENKHLVIIDDLMTTGATLQSAAKALQALKPASLTCLVVCRVV